MRVKVEYSPAALFGDVDPAEEGIDEAASMKRYAKQLKKALRREGYKDARVVNTGHDRISIDGMTDHDEAPWIEQVVHRVWDAWDWLVYA